MAKLLANSWDSDQMPLSAVSDLDLHCLPITLLRISQQQWVYKTGIHRTPDKACFQMKRTDIFLFLHEKHILWVLNKVAFLISQHNICFMQK